MMHQQFQPYIEAEVRLVPRDDRPSVYDNLIDALIYPQHRPSALALMVLWLVAIVIIFVMIIAVCFAVAVGIWGGQRLGVW